MPKAIFLVPGYGAQGGGADDVVPCFNEDGRGAIVNSSRGIIFAYQNKGNDEKFALFAKEAAEQMKEDLNASLKKAGIHL
jgi:orotidine-5'-phosphate decarboxylase